MITVVLGLGCAFGYALHDFLMVKVVRAASVWTAVTWSMGVSLVLLLPLALVLDGLPSGPVEWRAAAFAAAAGVCEAAALGCLLRGLVTGNLSIVTPLASLAGGFVAVVMVLRGESLSGFALAGLALAVAGALLASFGRPSAREGAGPESATRAGPHGAVAAPFATAAGPDGADAGEPLVGDALVGVARPSRSPASSGAGWALLSSLLFAGTVLLLVEAKALSPFALAAYGRLGTIVVLVPIALLLAGLRLPRPLARRAASAGVFDAAGFVAFAAAISIGPVAVASVLVSQGSTMAVLLGYVFLRERLSRVQYAGVACTCVAVAMLAAG